MSLAVTLRRLEQHPFLRVSLSPARRLWRWLFARRCEWQARRLLLARATRVCECPDLERLPRVADAGRVRGKTQVMHNGVLVEKGSYYGRWSICHFRRTRGVHEPQEEVAFAAVLPFMPRGAEMIELGSYWAFYSIWFARCVPDARCHLVEPVARHLDIGRRNFALNSLQPASAQQAFVDRVSERSVDRIRTVTLDDIVVEQRLPRIHLLHADIQGYERAMLEGARGLIAAGRIDYFFVSTHSEELHRSCREFLVDAGLVLLTDVSPRQSYSVDGVLVARHATAPGPDRIDVSLCEPPPNS